MTGTTDTTSTRRTGLLLRTAAALAAATLGAVVAAGSATAATTDDWTLIAGGSPVTRVSADSFTTSGTTSAAVSVASLGGGTVSVVAGPSGWLPQAFRFPAYVASGPYPRAALALRPTSGGAFDPGADDFVWYAVFSLDTVSGDRTVDDGNNLLQRGLSSSSSQYKLDVDDRRPACTLHGDRGKVVVRSSMTVTPLTWYRAACHRTGDALTVAVTRYGPDGLTGTTVRDTASGDIGALSFPSTLPASVGGKLRADGTMIDGATDQLNGRVARATVQRSTPVRPRSRR